MTLRAHILQVLGSAGLTVMPWGNVNTVQAHIVRPAGVVSGREVVEVWIVNPPGAMLVDPDSDLDGAANTLAEILRTELIDLSIVPGPEYDPTGKAPCSTLVATGTQGSRGLA